MKMAKKLLPLAAMGKIMGGFGAPRVSIKAKKALKQELEEFAKGISERAVSFASHAKRRTVMAEDVKLALK